MVCISGATGDCAVINNTTTGWTLHNGGSGGSYVFDNGSVKVTLELSDYTDIFGSVSRCRDWLLKAYRKSGGSWVECFSASGGLASWSNMTNNCLKSGAVGGVAFSIKPMENWFPSKMRLTISGHVSCATSCTAATNNGFYYRVNSVSLDGIYEVPLVEVSGYSDCSYRLNGVGSYSYTTWSSSGCTGSTKTVTGTFNILVYLTGTQVRVRITQSTSDAGPPGDEFHAFVIPALPCNCRPDSDSSAPSGSTARR